MHMRPGYGMFQQQTTKMQITPQLRKAITILKLSTPELLEVIQQEVTENPVLEIAENKRDPYNLTPTFFRGAKRTDPNNDPFLYIASNEVSLEKHLKEQLGFIQKIPPLIRHTVSFMIGNLDHNGFLRSTLPEISEVCKIDLAQVERALRILQSLEPRGIGARDLRECLLLQVQSLADSFPLVSLLIKKHLNDIANYHIHKLTTLLHVSTQEIQAAIDVIKGLNPRPGAAFHIETVHYIIPEVSIEKAGEQLVVLLHQAASSGLSVSGYYERMASEHSDNNELSKFLSGKLHAAKFFLKCLEQRRRTIFRVTQAIVEEQSDFFWHGNAHLKPMTLKQIAVKLGVHESTVSRATVGKYAQTPWGIYELKYFFPSGLQMDIGESASSEHVKSRIKTWISEENPRKPYSDQKLSDFMKKEGISISRRTITKYREELGISSSVRRKRI
ncbi:RNA polymerase sigma-54 factor [Paenibacillus allorhizoplanae]|uniref:RNA polymerase sigma-54 factor n=2 Tax=Paenibacillus allorhizoplanae TaxID=2905648 RepID=A0ABM9BWH4_9BACL|nr:RNA polymerase sigma-54 factor [Paenibacillus allorhizoplanae]